MYQFGRVVVILTIISVWWARVESGKSTRLVDCEKYVFHPHCRGTQAKKRIIEKFESGKADRVCMCKSGLGSDYGGRRPNSFPNSKLLATMLAHGFDVDAIYNAYSTYYSPSTVKNKNDGLRGNSVISSSNRRRKTSSSYDRSSRHRDGDVASEGTMRLPLSDNTINFADSYMDLDHSS